MSEEFKVKTVMADTARSPWQKYRDVVYGEQGTAQVVVSEIIVLLFSWIPGALGHFLRKAFYPSLFKQAGRGVVFGRDLTIRHGHKITLGDNVILDDRVVLDAKGDSNRGISIGNGVYIGRNTIVYCKNGDIAIGDAVNISSNCQVYSSNALAIGRHTIIGSFSCLVSGGQYDYTDRTKTFAEQDGMNTKGPLAIGPNCWIATGVVVADAASIGEHCVIGAGAVVMKPVPDHSLAAGVPAAVVRSIAP